MSSPADSRVDVTSSSGRSASKLRPTAGQVTIVTAVALVLHGRALVRKAALNGDEATIAVIARMMRHGARLYTSAVDRKPPGAFVVYRLLEPLFGTWTLAAGRWVALVFSVIAMWLLGFEANRRWPEVSPFAVALIGVIAFALLPAEDSRAVGFELLATLPAVAAFVLGARRRFLLAGIALGIAALFKQPMLLGALPLAVQVLFVRNSPRDERWMRRLVRLGMTGLATAATVVAGLIPFGLRNAWGWYAGVGDNYLGGTHITTVLIVALEQLGSFAGLMMGLLILAVFGAYGGRASHQRRAGPEGPHAAPRPQLDIVVWLGASVLATAIGLRFILHYFDQVLPPLVMCVAPVLADPRRLFARQRRLPRFALLWLVGGLTFSGWTLLDPNLFHDLPRVDPVAQAIDALTTPGQRIFVWGQAPEIYWLSNRDPATRYPHIAFITGVTPKRPGVPAYVLSKKGAAAILLGDLERNRPALIVDAAIEVVRGGNRYPLATSPIAAYVAANYCEIEVVDNIRLLSPCRP